MQEKRKRIREFLAEKISKLVADKVLDWIFSINFLAGVWAVISGTVTRISTELSQVPITKIQTSTGVLLALATLLLIVLFGRLLVVMIDLNRTRKDVLFIPDGKICRAFYVNMAELDPFPFCKKDKIRMNPLDMSSPTYKCGECGDEIRVSIYSKEWEYSSNIAISKAEKILRKRK